MLELQFQKAPCRFLSCAAGGVQNLELTQELKLTDGMPDIGRVLCAWGQVIARGKEWRGDEALFSGGVMVWVLYAPEDGTDPRCMEGWLPFQARWDLPEAGIDGTLRVRCLLRFADARNVSARRIMLRVGVGVKGEAYLRSEQDISVPAETETEVEILKQTYPLRLYREAGEKTVLLDEELTLPESCPQPEKLLYYTLQPEITDQKVLSDKVVFRGNGNLHILYRSEEGQLYSWDFELPFSQFSDLDGTYTADAYAALTMEIANLDADLDDEGHLRVKCGMVGQYLIEDTQLVEIAEDAYSLGRESRIQTGILSVPAILESRQEILMGEQTIPQDVNLVVDTVFLPDHPQQRRSADVVQLDVPGVFQVLYYGTDGSLQSGTARWEGQWSMPADENTAIDAVIQPMGRPQGTVNAGINVSAEANLAMNAVSSAPIPMVTGMELGEVQTPDPGRPSLILQRAGDQRLWDIARNCGSTVRAIQQLNALDGEPAAEQMLLIPVS